MREVDRRPEVDTVVVLVNRREVAVPQVLERQDDKGRGGDPEDDSPVTRESYLFGAASIVIDDVPTA